MRANRRRLAAAAVVALGAALAVRFTARRRRRGQLAPPAPVRPPAPPVVLPPPAPAAPPAASVLAAEPPPVPVAPAKCRRRWRRIPLVVAALVVVAAAGIGTSFAFHPGFTAEPAGTAPTTTPPTTTTTTTPTTTGTTTTTPARSGSGPLCATAPHGWKSKWVPSPVKTQPSALVLTNFGFGDTALEWGLLDPHVHWAPGDVMVVVADWTKAASAAFRSAFFPSALQIRRTDIARYGTFPVKIGHRLIRTNGRLLEVWAEARPPTAATLAAANRVLAGVAVCSAKS